MMVVHNVPNPRVMVVVDVSHKVTNVSQAV